MNRKFYSTILLALVIATNSLAQTKVVLESGDEISEGVNGGMILDTDNKKVGSGSLSITTDDMIRYEKNFPTPISTGVTRENGYLSFWLYISDVSKIKTTDGQIELKSANDDVSEYNWHTGPIKDQGIFQNGWNKIILRLKDANLGDEGGSANLEAVTKFKIYFPSDGNITTKIDNVVIYSSATGTFENSDTKLEWGSRKDQVSLDFDDFKEGQASIVSDGRHGVERFVIQKVLAFNSGVTREDGYLNFWLFVDDVSKYKSEEVGGGQIEISSSGAADVKEVNWSGNSVFANLQNGWNHVALKLSAGSWGEGSDNLLDLTNVNFFRIYFGSHSTMLTKIDGIRFSTSPDVLPVELISFNAVQKTNGVALNWSTASETNSSHFEVLRSANGVDFTSVARVQSNGKASAYSVVDDFPFTGKNYYKLLQVDKDGAVNNLGVKVVNSQLANAGFKVYPTFVSDKINIKLGDYNGKFVKAMLINAAGQQVFSKQINTTPTTEDYVIDVNHLAVKGIHFLIIQGENYIKQAKLIF